MFCLKCGEFISDDSIFCPRCGEKVVKAVPPDQEERAAASSTKAFTTQTAMDEPATVVIGDVNAGEPKYEKAPKKSKNKWTVMAIVAVVVIAVVFFAIQAVGKSNLKKQLLRDWQTVDSTLLLELDFSDDEIEYNAYTGYKWLDTTIFTMEYKVISPNKIKILDYDKVIEIEFNDDKTMMICIPAITSTDSIEYWFNRD